MMQKVFLHFVSVVHEYLFFCKLKYYKAYTHPPLQTLSPNPLSISLDSQPVQYNPFLTLD